MPTQEACGGPMMPALIAPGFPWPSDAGFGGESAGRSGAQRGGDVFPDRPEAVRALYAFHRGSLTRYSRPGAEVAHRRGSFPARLARPAPSPPPRRPSDWLTLARTGPRQRAYIVTRSSATSGRRGGRSRGSRGAPRASRIRRGPARGGRPSRRPPGPSAQMTAGYGRRGALRIGPPTRGRQRRPRDSRSGRRGSSEAERRPG
jgi:hypothetical protein